MARSGWLQFAEFLQAAQSGPRLARCTQTKSWIETKQARALWNEPFSPSLCRMHYYLMYPAGTAPVNQIIKWQEPAPIGAGSFYRCLLKTVH